MYEEEGLKVEGMVKKSYIIVKFYIFNGRIFVSLFWWKYKLNKCWLINVLYIYSILGVLRVILKIDI